MGLPAQQPLQDDVKTLRKFVNHLPPTGDLQKFSLVLPTSHEVYHGGKPIVIVVYFFNSLTPESDTHIISPDSFTPKSSIKVMRIRGDICKIKKNSVIGQILFVSTIGNVLQRSYNWRLGWKWLFFSKL